MKKEDAIITVCSASIVLLLVLGNLRPEQSTKDDTDTAVRTYAKEIAYVRCCAHVTRRETI